MSRVFTIPNFLSSQECNEVIAKCKSELELKQAALGKSKEVHSKQRKSSIAFIKDLGSVNTRLTEILISNINLRGFNASGLGRFQFTEYKIGEYYDWHTDSGLTFPDRIYSTVIQLNDTYTEGELEVKEGTEVKTLTKGIGSLYVFPSNYIHRVKPISTGIRYSLVNWVKAIKKENIELPLI